MMKYPQHSLKGMTIWVPLESRESWLLLKANISSVSHQFNCNALKLSGFTLCYATVTRAYNNSPKIITRKSQESDNCTAHMYPGIKKTKLTILHTCYDIKKLSISNLYYKLLILFVHLYYKKIRHHRAECLWIKYRTYYYAVVW